jgi:cytoskeletal protein CcmA (bactofilin family)
MFGNSKKPEGRPAPTMPTRSRVPSIVSADMTVKGELRSEGELHLDGTVEGEVHAQKLVIGETATVKGNVHADSVRVCGRLEGNVTAREVVLTSTARMTGDITHETMSLEPGARFAGAVKHVEPTKPAGPPALAAPKATPTV